MPATPELFDGQATRFGARAGLPAAVCDAVATAVIEVAHLETDDLVVELGAGGGAIGHRLAAKARYFAVDFSLGMLATMPAVMRSLSVRADGNRRWPLAGGLRALFGSRALHLLDAEHLVMEVCRIASPLGATLIAGRVARAADDPRRLLAGELRRQLREHGAAPRGGAAGLDRLRAACCRAGLKEINSLSITNWQVDVAPRQSLTSWRSIPGLGGVSMPGTAKDRLLDGLERWAEERLGDLDRPRACEERYVLHTWRLARDRRG